MKNRVTAPAAFIAVLTAAASCAQAQEVSFTNLGGVLSAGEGSTVDAIFSVSPAQSQSITVLYDVDYDTADAADHEPVSGEVEVPAGATAGTIRISIRDDTDIEPPRETFDIRLTLSASYTLGSQSSVTVNIHEGICDRTPQVQTVILAQLAGLHDCDAVTDRNLTGITVFLPLNSRGITSLQVGDFSGLTQAIGLNLFDNRLTSLPAGVFEGLDNSRRLWIGTNDLTTLPPALFKNLYHLNWLTIDSNEIERLSEGFFLGAGALSQVDLTGNPGAPFMLTPRLQRVGSTMTNLLPRVNAKLTLPESTPLDIEVRFSTEGGTVSPDSVTLFRGTTQNDVVVAMTQTGAAPVRVTLNVPGIPRFGRRRDGFPECTGDCYKGFATSGGAPFVLDAVAPTVSGAGFFSAPAYGDAYSVQAGETISVEVRFNENVVISGGPPLLHLNVGGTMRNALYDSALSSSTVLVFSYQLASGDSDDDGVGFADDALVLPPGTRISDPQGHDADLALGEHAVMNHPDHRVAPRSLALRFEPAETVLTPGETTEVQLILENAEALTGSEEVAVTLTPSALLEASSPRPVLGMMSSSSMTLTISTREDAPFESGTLTASGTLADARVTSGELAVSVVRREVEVLISPDELTLLRGGAAPSEAGTRTVTIRTRPELRGDEIAALDLTASAGLGLSPRSVTLSSMNQTATVQVSATMDGAFEGEVTASTNAGTDAGRTVLHLDEASASVAVRRSVNLQFEWAGAPEPLRLEIGASTTVEVSVEPPLLASEEIAVDLRLASGAGVRLNKRRLVLDADTDSSTVEVTAQAFLINDRLIVEVSPAQVHVGPSLSLVEVQTTTARRVLLRFDPATVQFIPGRSTSFRVTTVPLLGPGQSLTAPLTVAGDAPLSFRVGGVPVQAVTVSGETTRTAVTVTTSEAASWATGGSAAGVTVERGALTSDRVEILDPLPVLQAEVTTLHLSVSVTPPQELVLETGVPKDVFWSIGEGELLPGESVSLRPVTDVPGLTVEPRNVVVAVGGSSMIRVTASQDNVQGRLRFEAEAGVVLNEEVSLDVRVKRDFRLRLDPPAVTLSAGDSADVRVALEGAEDLTAGRSVNLRVQPLEGINFSPGPLSRLTPSRVASLRVSRDTGSGLGEHVVTITSDPDPDIRLLPAQLSVTVLPFEVTVSVEPDSVALLRGGTATAVVRADPPLQFSERIVVDLIPVAGFEVEPSRVLLARDAESVKPVTISASARTSDQGFIFLRESAVGALTHAVIRFGRGSVRLERRGVELKLTREEQDESPAPLGVPVAISLSTSPPLVLDERVEVRLRTQDDALSLDEEVIVLHGGRQSALFSATPQRPGATGRITASGVGRGVVVTGATLDVEVGENAERVSLEFNPPRVQIRQGRASTVRLVTRPLLGAGQSISVVLKAGGGSKGAALGAFGRYLAVELDGDGEVSREVAVSVPVQAEVGSTAAVSIAGDFTRTVGVSLETPLPELTIEVVTPRITVSFASVGGDFLDTLLLGPGETETVEVRFDSGSQAVLEMEIEGDGLTVSPARVTFPQPKPATQIAVVEVSASEAEVVGMLKASVVSAAELSATPVLPVRVQNTLSFDPAEVSVRRGESKEITLRLGSTRSLTAGEQVTVDLSALELAGNFGLSPNEVTFSAVQPAVTVEITAETDAPTGTVIRSRSRPWPAPALASGSIALAEPLRVSVLPRTFEVLFEPDEIVLVGGGVASATVSMTVTVKVTPEFLPGEEIVADLEIDPGGAPLELSVSRVTLDPRSPTTQVTVTTSLPDAGTVLIAVQDALSPEVSVEGSLSVEVIRAVEPTLVGARASLTMTAGESRQLTVTTNPPLDEDETAVVLLGSENGALSWNTPRLMLSKATTQIEVTATADVPDTADRLTLSWQGEGVSVVGGDLQVPVAIGRATMVSVVFEPEMLGVEQGRSKTFSVTTDPLLAVGQEVSVQLVLPGSPPGFSLDETMISLSGAQRSREVRISAPVSAAIGSMISVGLDTPVASGVGVTDLLSLPVEVTAPEIAIEFSPADELIVKTSRRVTLSLSRDNGLIGGQSAALEVSVTGAGLSVDPQTVTLSGDQPASAVWVTAGEQAHGGATGELRVGASGGAGLPAPAVLPVKVLAVTIAPEADENALVAEAGEGETVNAVVRVTPSPMTSLRVSYVFGATGDTADAGDYSVPDSLVIPAGESSARLSIKIVDDDDIEPPREWFTVALAEVDLYHLVLPSISVRVVIREGVCDRTPQVQDEIRGDAGCDEVTSDDLAGLTRMSLPGKSIGPRGLRVGDFSGMDELTAIILNDNSIFSLPPGIFADLDRLQNLHLESNQLRDLPPGVFAGLTRLQQLHVDRNVVDPFVLTVALRRVNQPPAEPAQFRLVVEEGAPFQMNVGLTVTGGTASESINGPGVPSLTISKGSTQSLAFFVSASGSQEVNIGLTPPPVPSECTISSCYNGIATAVGAPLVLDAIVPMLTGVEIVSTPAGKAYSAGETISVALEFNEEIIVIPGRGDLALNLDIGSDRRTAGYDADRSGTGTLVFSYEVGDDDEDTNGISVREDALALNGARLEDRSGVIADPSLAGYEISDAEGHAVLRVLLLVFDPPVVEVEWGGSATFTVTTRPPISRAGESVEVFLNLTEAGAAGLALSGAPLQFGAYPVMLSSAVPVQRNNVVTAQPRAEIGSSVTLSYSPDSDGSPIVRIGGNMQLRMPLPLLSVEVTAPKRTVAFSPAGELFLEPGGQGEVTLGFADGETPSTTATLRVSAGGGFSVVPETVRLGPSTPTTMVTVTAPATTERAALKVEALSGVALREAAELPLLSGYRRDFTLSFEPVSLDLVAGVSTPVRVVLGNAEALTEGEVVYVALTPGAGLELSPPVLLDRLNPAMAVDLRAVLGAPLGASSVTAQVSAAQARYLIAHFGEATLPVEVLERRITVLFEPAEVRLAPGASEEEPLSAVVEMRTEPELVESEELFLNLTVLDRRGRVILSGVQVQPSLVRLRPGLGPREVAVFSSNKEIALVRPQWDARSTVEEGTLRLEDLRVIFPGAGLQLRLRVFLEGALE